MIKQETKDAIIGMTEEFEREKGYITCEFSVHEDSVNDVITFVKENITSTYGKWVVGICETCVGYHGENYRHISIEKLGTIEKMRTADNKEDYRIID